MKKVLAFLLALAAWTPILGQATNPQNTFDNAVDAMSPSLWLNYNDATTVFKDQVSGSTMTNTVALTATPSVGANCHYGATTSSTLSCTLTATAGDALIVYVDETNYITPVTITKVVDSGGATDVPILSVMGVPGSSAFYFADVSAGSHTITVTLSAAITAQYPYLQVLDVAGAKQTSPVDTYVTNPQSATTAVTSGTLTTTGTSELLLGHAVGNGACTASPSAESPASTLVVGGYDGQFSGYYEASAAGSYTFNATGCSLPWSTSLIAIKPQINSYISGTIVPQQPGFDNTNPANYSAEFPYNGFSSAPNNTLGGFDWTQPETLMVQLDRMNWNRSGLMILASKGDLGSCAGVISCTNVNTWWQLFVTMNGLKSEVCFERNGSGVANSISNQICSSIDTIPNGYNYNIVVEQNGQSGLFSDLSMYINGVQVGGSGGLAGGGSSATHQYGFGEYQITVAAGGTGYASSTGFTSTGGGAYCSLSGAISATSGVMTTGASGVTYTTDNGCTSAPTIVLTSPTGTGATFGYQANGASMNSMSSPLMAPGYISSSSGYGIAGSTTTQNPTYVDEFAQFSNALSFGQVSDLFYTTKFYQLVANTLSPKPVVILDDDIGSDPANSFSLSLLIGMQKAGLITLAGVVGEDDGGSCIAMWRQFLDQAGLNNVPIGVPSDPVGTGSCYPTNITAYNASTPQTTGAYTTAATIYRTVFAKYSANPVIVVSGGPIYGLYEFMSSVADSISPLTGLQLLAQDAASGGAIYFQGGGCTASDPPASTPCTGSIDANGIDSVDGQYIVTNNGAMPLTWIGGTPQSAGPGGLSTRTSDDPFFLYLTSGGTDTRSCNDCLAVEAFASSLFTNGVQVGYSGGTGYAASTPFTLSGGGPNCQGAGIMTASGGVPNGIEYSWGVNGYEQSTGLGSGCTSAPTVNLVGATGTGVTLTAYPALVCGTVTVSESGSVWGDNFSSAKCSQHYTVPGNINTASTPASGALMTWFINSLVDAPPVGAPRTY